jgi:signal transduction histidine kinase
MVATVRMRLANMWVAATVILVVSISATAAQPKRILFFHSFGPNFQQGALWNTEIQRELNRQSPWPLDIQEHSLVTARNGDNAAEAKFVDYLGALYAQRPPDLIVAIGGPAARFVQEHRADLYPTTPMLLAAIEERLVSPSMLSEQDTVVAVRFNQFALAENILRLLPDTKSIAVILGNSPGEQFWVGEQKRVLGPLLANKAELTFYNEKPFEEILKEVAQLPPNSAIFFQQLAVDGAGAVYGDKEPLKRIYKVANAPIFTFDESYFTGETVGGPMFDPAKGARPMAAAALQMLGGEKAENIKVAPVEFAAPQYDWRQLQRWEISESRLPPGSEVLFRELSAWDKYRWQIVAIFAVMFLQGSTITGLLYEGRRRRVAEADAKQRLSELARINRHLTVNELGSSIAHELNQPLGAILNNTETMKILLGAQSPDLEEIREIVEDILRDDRRASEVILRLRNLLTKEPFELREIDLNQVVSDVVELLSSVAQQRDVKITKALSVAALPVRGDTVQLQQVLVNLIINGMDAMADTNGSPREINVRSTSVRGFAEVSVSDTGPGISPDQITNVFDPFFTTKQNGMGIGLSIVRTIVEAHGGKVWTESRLDPGAVFHISLPLSNIQRSRSAPEESRH